MAASPFRQAGSSDHPTVARLRAEFLAEQDDRPGLVDDMAFRDGVVEWLDRSHAGGATTWLADDGGDPIGMVTLILDTRPPRPDDHRTAVGFVVQLYVVPAARGEGLGRRLLDHVLAEARARGCRRVFLHASDDGRPMYLAAGFTDDPRFLDLAIPR